jgi:hypothetical protein
VQTRLFRDTVERYCTIRLVVGEVVGITFDVAMKLALWPFSGTFVLAVGDDVAWRMALQYCADAADVVYVRMCNNQREQVVSQIGSLKEELVEIAP